MGKRGKTEQRKMAVGGQGNGQRQRREISCHSDRQVPQGREWEAEQKAGRTKGWESRERTERGRKGMYFYCIAVGIGSTGLWALVDMALGGARDMGSQRIGRYGC